MIIERRRPSIVGVEYRTLGITWYRGYSIVVDLWTRRIIWAPRFIRR